MRLQDERWTERRERRSAKRREVRCHLQDDQDNEDDDGDSDDNDNVDGDDEEEEDHDKNAMMAVMMMEDQKDYIC